MRPRLTKNRFDGSQNTLQAVRVFYLIQFIKADDDIRVNARYITKESPEFVGDSR